MLKKRTPLYNQQMLDIILSTPIKKKTTIQANQPANFEISKKNHKTKNDFFSQNLTISLLRKCIKDFTIVNKENLIYLLSISLSLHNVNPPTKNCQKNYNSLQDFKECMLLNTMQEITKDFEEQAPQNRPERFSRTHKAKVELSEFESEYLLVYKLKDLFGYFKKNFKGIYLTKIHFSPFSDKKTQDPIYDTHYAILQRNQFNLSSYEINFLKQEESRVNQKLKETDGFLWIEIKEKISGVIKELKGIFDTKLNFMVEQILRPGKAAESYKLLKNDKEIEELLPCSEEIFFVEGEKKLEFNKTQEKIIKKVIYSKRHIELVHGPPGTGKTQTLVGSLINLLYLNKNDKILVCTSSNRALDEIIVRLDKIFIKKKNSNKKENFFKPNLIRLGIIDEFSDPKAIKHHLHNKALKKLSSQNRFSEKEENNESIRVQSKLIMEIEALTREIKIQRENSYNKKSTLHLLKDSLYQKTKKLEIERERGLKCNQEIKEIESKLITESQILFSTLNSSLTEELENSLRKVGYLFVDEASQSRQTELLLPLKYFPDRMILFGDHLQLQPTIKSAAAKSAGFGKSLFERLVESNFEKHFINIQYRMSPRIAKFPSEKFYDKKLKNSNFVLERKIEGREELEVIDSLIPIRNAFIDIERGKEKILDKSFYNSKEIEFVKDFLYKILKNSKKSLRPLLLKSIGIICGYRMQKTKMIQKINTIKEIQGLDHLLEIDTIDGFQGREKELIMVSTVRTEATVGFLGDAKRMNVSLTRAKNFLFVVGNKKCLKRNSFWKEYLNSLKPREIFYKKKDFLNFKKAE